MAQIRQVVSESLQATIRRLLPSQQGFTEDLQASNVITPIIDLTPTAEGSLLTADLAAALNFTDATAFSVNNATSVIANTPGFWRVVGSSTLSPQSGTRQNQFLMSDGLTSKQIWEHQQTTTNSQSVTSLSVDLIFFLSAGDSLSAANNNNGVLSGSIRQIADVSGNTLNPTDFTGS